jgi:hypothetical protein
MIYTIARYPVHLNAQVANGQVRVTIRRCHRTGAAAGALPFAFHGGSRPSPHESGQRAARSGNATFFDHQKF